MGNKAREGAAYCNIGIAHRHLGNFKQAIDYHNLYLGIAKDIGDRDDERKSYGNLGNDYQRLGNFKQAIEYHNLELSLAKEVGNRAEEGGAYGNLGNAYNGLGNFKKAIEYHKQRLSIAKEVENRAGMSGAYCNLGIAYGSLGDFKQAIEYHKQCLTINTEMGDRAGVRGAYGNMGSAYSSLGNFQQAIEYFKQCLTISKEMGDRAGEGRACCNLGSSYLSLGNFEQGIEYIEQQLSIAKEVGDRAEEGSAYGNLGSAYYNLSNVQEATKYHNQSLSVAKEVGDRDEEGTAYSRLGDDCYSLGDFKQAMEYHKLARSVAKEVGDSVGEGSACYSLGRDYESSGSFCEALDCYRSSVKLLDSTRALLQSEDAWKISFRDLYCFAYTALWRALLKNGETDEALSAVEQGRAQALMDILKEQYGIDALPSTSVEPKDTISFISNHLSGETVFLACDENTISHWVLKKGGEVHFQQKEIDHGSVILFMENTFKEIGAGLDVRCENRSMDELTEDQPSNREAVEEKVQLPTSSVESLRSLYDVIVGPIADLLQGDQLIVVPDGPLWLVPYSALSESIKIRTVPSLTALKIITDSPDDYHSKSGALLVGDPCLEKVTKKRGKPMYNPLPCAKKEVEMIGEILKIPPLTGTEATKAQVLERISSVALIHIAAHGRKETGEIALAPNPGWTSKVPKQEDYILKISDVQAVKLRVRLVVLSCCHSGKGDIRAEGVVGLARAFLCAGARSVLVSLWAIDDEATMQFMKSFYQHLADGKSASVALHQAMKSLRESEQFAAARYWAPFVLIGDDVTLELGEQK